MPNRFVRVEFNGFWTHATIDAFKVRAGEIVQNAIDDGARPGQSRILVVARNFPVQEKKLTRELGEFMPMYSMLAKRFAIVSSDSAIQRLQIKRLTSPDNCQIFLDEAEARTWLFAI
ncbi:hypothetical protein KCP91_04785 [Microvirga sp. SRT01]|uniref:STAS/SEC14 domain-containing protein n=1 Tax=Sphingomonas longa TaxID=2778730 RepID=A0ABS2D426_9SPHN|nr:MULTISPECIES: hypothetical protein [Alphaproteobacteria]MBM6575678.1 hypothetical protein [Sphingomonas sp. BT552]MBR7708725.1 hypothetical protein [Microvirga sp. SRT01]